MDNVQRAIEAIKNGTSVEDAMSIVAGIDEDADGQDIAMTQAFFIRCLEWAREDAKDDVAIHKFAESVFSASRKDDGDPVAVKSKDFDGVLKHADEMVSSAGVGGFIGGTGPSRSYPVKKKKKKASTNESATDTKKGLMEYFREPPSIRIELDGLEFLVVHAGATKATKKCARDLTNAVARKYAGTYDALSEYDLKQVISGLDEVDADESVSEEGSAAEEK